MTRPTLLATFAALAVLMAGPSAADSVHINAATLDALLLEQGRLFELSGRLGDGAETLHEELSLAGGLGSLHGGGHFAWTSNREEEFRLSCEDGRLEFELGGLLLAFEPGAGPRALYLHCAAEPDGSGVTLIDLRLDGEHLGDSCWTVGPWGEEVLWIENAGLAGGFELTGTVNLAWVGEAPDADALRFALGGSAGDGSNARSWSQVKRLY